MKKEFIVVVVEICNGLDNVYLTKAINQDDAIKSIIETYVEFWNMPTKAFEERYECIAFLKEDLTII